MDWKIIAILILLVAILSYVIYLKNQKESFVYQGPILDHIAPGHNIGNRIVNGLEGCKQYTDTLPQASGFSIRGDRCMPKRSMSGLVKERGTNSFIKV